MDFGFSTGGIGTGPGDGTTTSRAKAYAQTAAICGPGARLRIDGDWWAIQDQATSAYDWSKLDGAIDEALAVGVTPMVILHRVPPWANGTQSAPDPRVPPDASHAGAQYDFFLAAMRRYVPRGVTQYQIGNEVNLRSSLGVLITGTQYANGFLVQGAGAARVVASELKVPVEIVLTSLVSPDTSASNYSPEQDPATFLTRVYANGSAWQFDHVAWHPYHSTSVTPNTAAEFNAKYAALWEIMRANGDAAKKTIICTEYGLPTSGQASVTEAEQATRIVEAMAKWRTLPSAGDFYVYSLTDRQPLGTGDRENYFGVMRNTGAYKPAYHAIRNYLAQ